MPAGFPEASGNSERYATKRAKDCENCAGICRDGAGPRDMPVRGLRVDEAERDRRRDAGRGQCGVPGCRDAVDEAQYEALYVASLRSVGVAARLGAAGTAEIYGALKWIPAPRPLISPFVP